MKKVIVESPYAGNILVHIAYAKRAIKDSLDRSEAPYASHLFFTQEGILDDTKPEERKLGIEAGLLWGKSADLTAVYSDYGLSKGMEMGIERAKQENRPIEYREIGKNKLPPPRSFMQDKVDFMFNYMMNQEKLDFPEDCQQIQRTLKTFRGVNISYPEAAKFWKWRSNLWEASWLGLSKTQDEILEYWDKFIEEWYREE